MRTEERTLEIRSGRRSLVDEPDGLVVAGARPGAAVTVAATVEVNATVRQVTATFDAVLERHWLAPGATLTPVRDPGVWGLFARPAGEGPFPAVVCFAGSSGGLAASAAWAPVLASHGFATLAIAYFGVPGLPAALAGIEVEVVERAAPGCSAGPTSPATGSRWWGCPAAASSPCWPGCCWTGCGRWSPSRPAGSAGPGWGPAGRWTCRPGPSAASRSPTSASTAGRRPRSPPPGRPGRSP